MLTLMAHMHSGDVFFMSAFSSGLVCNTYLKRFLSDVKGIAHAKMKENVFKVVMNWKL